MRTMRRFALALAAAVLPFVSPSAAGAESSAPLAAGLDALRATDYAKAEHDLAAVRGADQPAAQVALARVMLETGRYADAERVAKGAGGSANDKLAAVAVRAEALFAQGKVADAIKLLEASAAATSPAARRV